jgi:hypothetical protein
MAGNGTFDFSVLIPLHDLFNPLSSGIQLKKIVNETTIAAIASDMTGEIRLG